MTELVGRFLIGGIGVSLFAAIGSAFEPKTFAGMFGSAPSIALTTLALTFHERSPVQVEHLARSMLLGAAALLVYSVLCAIVVRLKQLNVLLGSVAAWVGWGLVAACLFTLILN